MTNALSSQLSAATELAMQEWGRAQTIGGFVVLSLVDRLPPVQRRYRLELEIRDSLFAAGRAYEREVLGLPPRRTPAAGSAAQVAATVHPSRGSRHTPPHRRHLHLV